MRIEQLHKIFLQSSGIATDTRKISKNKLFFALKGNNFDGNKFAIKAIEQGASFSIIDNKKFYKDEKTILVDNVLKTLQKLAIFHREYLNLPIIAITGTNGKTTTKELIREVLSKKFNVSATKGNFNNHIGVPLTILSMNKATQIGIVEMGANHQGEIEKLCKIAKPNYGLITNIGHAHIEGFGSFEGVVKAKTELYKNILSNNNSIFINSDDNLLNKLSKNINKIEYGTNKKNYYNAENLGAEPFLKLIWNKKTIKTNLVGSYNFYNVMAAITIGKYFKVDDDNIVSALESYKPKNNRSQFLETNKNKLIIDAYNANPSSMTLAINNFYDIKANSKILIIGDMFELGNESEIEHQKIIELVNKLDFKNVFFVGNNFYKLANNTKTTNYIFFKDTSILIEHLKTNKLEQNYILLKASRGIMLEKIIEYL